MHRLRGSERIDDPHALLMELMRADFSVFLRKALPWVSGGNPILWNWHLDAIVHALNRVMVGQSRRLLINMPPRYGKSIATSIAWVAWVLGRDPSHRFVCVSYSNSLSADLADKCLRIVQAPWYRELFPGTILRRTAVDDLETTRGGGRLATSVTGTLTGRGGDTIVLDDLIKPQEASSEVVRASVNAWYQSTLSSRLNNKRTGAIVCVMQRLHEYDIAGLMIESGGYHVLSLPAIATTEQVVALPRGKVMHRPVGHVLHPARENLQLLEEQRAAMGSDRFSAQYNQEPVPAVGNIIRAAWFRNYDPVTVRLHGGQIVQSIDTANKANPGCDFSVVVTALVRDKHIYILDVARFRAEFFDLKRRVIALAQEHRPYALLIEEQASGISLISELRGASYPGVPAPIACKAVLEKYERVEGISAMIEAGQLLLPPDASWLSEFKAELLACPNGRYDDQVDALVHLMTWVRDRYNNRPILNAGPELICVDDGPSDWDSEDSGLFDSDGMDDYIAAWGAR